MISYIVLSLVIIAFIISSLEDIKKREVYDYITFFLTFAVLVTAIAHSFVESSLVPLKYVGFGLLIGFALGSLLYYVGMWGGGDAKFLIGFGAASYYLINFMKEPLGFLSNFETVLQVYVKPFFMYFLEYFLSFLLIFDFIFLFLLLFFFARASSHERKKNIFRLFFIILLLSTGLLAGIEGSSLLLLGFLAFLLIFFGEDELFTCIYLVLRRNVKRLRVGDSLEEGERKRYSVPEFLRKEDLKELKEHHSKIKFKVKKFFPLGTLITLNYIVYIVKVLSLDSTTILLFAFLLLFLVYSFFIGGILALIILFLHFLRKPAIVSKQFKGFEKISFLVLTIFTLVGFYVNVSIGLVFLIGFLYYFVKLVKVLESDLFIKPKKLEDIVLGDWIAQNIRVDKKLVFKAEEFKLGVNEKQLERIKQLAKKNSSLKTLLVKDGIAFLPPLFLGFLVLIFL